MSSMLPRTGRLASASLLSCLALIACGNDPVAPATDAAAADGGLADAQPAPDASPLPDAAAPDATADDAQPAADAEADAGVLPACDPALSLQPLTRAVGALQLISFTAAGGTEDYRFDLVEDGSGALVNELTGAYLAGRRVGTTDRVRVRDVACAGEAVATIRVVDPLIVRPSGATIRPGTRFTFDVRGGSGRTTFTLASDRSGATLTSSGTYTAGAGAGLDQVRVEDLETGDVVRVELLVDPATRLAADPPDVYLTEGGTFRLRTTGGSGEISLPPAPDLVLVQDSVLTGTAAGSRTLTLTDPFTGDTTPVRITVAGVQRLPAQRAGNGFFFATALAPGDLDGDGQPDVVFALPDHDYSANTGGVVFVYRGGTDALVPTPAQAFGGQTRGEELGRGVAVADLDDDGHPELIIGSPRADITGTDSGAVRIYRGLASGLFDTTPTKTLSGRFAADLFGSTVAACDFNGDGRLDLAIAARGAEDRGRAPVPTDQGGVHVFVQRPTGFRDEPDQSLWGDVPNMAGDLVGQGGLLFGLALAAGDLDGDGACDLAASSIDYDQVAANNTNDGLVYVYRGVHEESGARGGLSAAPVLGWASTSTADVGAAFGRALTIGELDGNDRPELVMLAPNGDAGNGDNHGIVRIRAGAALPTMPITALTPARAVEWSYVHNGDQDQLGFAAAIGDLTGDGAPDLVVGALRDEAMGSPDGTGTVVLFRGVAGQLPERSVVTVRPGIANGDSFGAALTLVGDLGTDGVPDLFVFATSVDTYGRDVGQVYTLDGRLDRAPAPLSLPGVPSGLEAGRGADLAGDLDGDGLLDLVVGAPRDNSMSLGANSGAAYVYRGTASGFARDPAAIWREFPGHAGGDAFGQAVSRAGDFDGDGRDDVAILARSDDRPATFAAADFELEPGCAGLPAANDVGAVHVFRGSAAALPTRPSTIVFGVEVGDVIDGVLGGFDYDGDGLDDLLVASASWDTATLTNSGGFALIRGRAPTASGRIRVVCAYDFVLHAGEANTAMGRSLTSLGDLDADGCDDVAIGAPSEDLGNLDQGSLRVLYGFGAGCAAGPRMATLTGGTRSAQAFFSIASEGRSLDGDTVPDLVLGIAAHVAGGNNVGAARVVTGATLRALPTEAPVDGVAPTNTRAVTGPLVVGRTVGGGFGRAVAMGDSGVWVGAPLADYSGVVASGGATLHAFDRVTGMISAAPSAVMGGETRRDNGRIGELLMSSAAAPYVLITGFDGQGGGVDLGSAYVLRTR